MMIRTIASLCTFCLSIILCSFLSSCSFSSLKHDISLLFFPHVGDGKQEEFDVLNKSSTEILDLLVSKGYLSKAQ
eukprot:m.67473 g.67473  ORF g.67473 m.67473 type:complete len:75 (+) comp13633_c1_seq6:98-322(+)